MPAPLHEVPRLVQHSRHKFLRALHPEGFRDVRVLGGPRVGPFWIPVADLDRVDAISTRWQAQHVYVGVATRAHANGGSLEDCLALHALFADIDYKLFASESAARARLAAFPLVPSMVVASGDGLHCYWLLDLPLDLQSGGAHAKQCLRALAVKLGADLQAAEPARILRLPGTLNHKYTPPRAVVVELFSDATYTLAEMVAALGPLPERQPDTDSAPPVPHDLPAEERLRQARAWLARQSPAIQGQGGDQYTYSICCSVAVGHDLTEDEAFAVLHDWNAGCRPPWAEAELRQKLRNAARYHNGVRGEKLQRDVVIRGGELSSIVDRAEAALLDTTPLYQRGGQLVRPITLDTAIGDAETVRRAAGSTMLVAVRDAWLSEQMGRVLRWVRPTKKDTRTAVDPPAIYARTLLSRGEWRFPVLRGVVTAPTLDRDGRIISVPGFDAASGLLLDFPRGAFPPIPDEPTEAEAKAALARLAGPLRGFPFVDDAARSVAVGALLTALVRVSLRTAPLHGFDAPTAGTGKSLLAEAVGLLATGVRPPALSQGKSAEEDEKRLSTVLFAGDPVVHIDNCEREISGDFLCSMLTQEVVQARILGLSERRVLPSTALVLASGNNLTFAGDTSRRAVVCRLDAQVERPDAREFNFDVHAEVIAARPELVVAGLTVLRAYAVAGRPVRLTPMGSFNDWEWVRGALVWLGCADPADTRAAILDNDPRKNELLEVMELWDAGLGTADAFEVSDIERRAEAFADSAAALAKRQPVILLRDKLIEAACRGGKWSGKSVGWWLRRHKDRVVGGRCFSCAQGHDGQRWQLLKSPWS